MQSKDEGDFAVYQAVDLREEDDAENGIRAWQCSICQTVQPIEIDPCQTCSHPRDQAPEADDVIIINWQPNEGEMDMMVGGEGEDGDEEPGAAPAMDSIDVVRPEGELDESSDWGDEDEDDSGDDWGVELVDPSQDIILVPREEIQPEGIEPSHPDKGWVCGACNRENSMIDLQCISCGKYRNMRENGIDDVILLRAEVTAGQRPNAEPEEKDLEIYHEVWPCPECSSVNDYKPHDLVCFRCNHVLDTTKGELISFSMPDAEYTLLVGGPRQEAAGRRGGGGGGGGSAVAPSVPAGGGGGAPAGGGGGFFSSAAAGRAKKSQPKRDPKPQVRNLRNIVDDFSDTPPVVRRNAQPVEYPIKTDLGFKDPNRLGRTLGVPNPLPCFAGPRSFWRDGTIVYPCIRIRDILGESNYKGTGGLVDRGFDVNEDGCLAVLSGRKLRVYRPLGPSFQLRCEAEFDGGAQSEHLFRARYRGNIVYIFHNYRVQRFEVDPDSRDIRELDSFTDDYMKDQLFKDVDVRDGLVCFVWRKWAGLYKWDAFTWFHAVSTSTVVMNPKSMAFTNSYLHITMGSCLLAFHVSSRDPTVLWVNGNLPERTDVPFCVSKRYGVFTHVHRDIIQSFYDALTAQSVWGDSCERPGGAVAVTPAPKERRELKHAFHKLICGPRENPFAEVTHIEYDESFGQHGRLLCWDAKSAILFMGLNRGEFDPLEEVFRRVFLERKDDDEDEALATVVVTAENDGRDFGQSAVDENDGIPPFGLLDLMAMENLALNDRVDYRCDDGRYRVGTVRASGGALIVLGFEDPDVDVERVENAPDCIDRFAFEGEVTGRPRCRLHDVDVDSEVSVNLNNMGWTSATAVEFDASGGQVAVLLGNGEIRWTHLDFENEIRHRQAEMAEATEFVATGTPGASATESGPDLMGNVTQEQREEIETIYVDFSTHYGEAVVKWFLGEAVKLDVQSSPTGLRVLEAPSA